jgi:hypothetical protein
VVPLESQVQFKCCQHHRHMQATTTCTVHKPPYITTHATTCRSDERGIEIWTLQQGCLSARGRTETGTDRDAHRMERAPGQGRGAGGLCSGWTVGQWRPATHAVRAWAAAGGQRQAGMERSGRGRGGPAGDVDIDTTKNY